MSRVRNIAKIMMLTAVILLLGMNRYAHAQSNTPGGPYINSWHQYSVVKGLAGNTSTWTLFNTLADATNNTGGTLLNGQSWVALTSTGTELRIAILFDGTVFSAPSTRYLVYAEFSGALCVARRIMELNIEPNTFYEDLPVSENGNTCNSFTGRVWDNTVDDLSLIQDVTSVIFTVYMQKGDDDFYIDNWQFDGVVTVTGGAVLDASVFPANTGSSDRGSWTINDGATLNDGIFHMTVETPDNVNFVTDYLTFSVNVLGIITQDFDIRLEITGGIANSGSVSTYVSVTADNGSGNRIVARKIFGVPNTSVVMVTP